MKILNIRQVRESLSNLDHLLAQEGEVIITRRGEKIARVLPIAGHRPMPSHDAMRRSMPRLRRGSEQLIRKDRNGR